MVCININDPKYQEILKEVNNLLIANAIYRQRYLKDGVDFVFDQTPELADIGSYEEYSQYLDTIFPESKVKDIVYHGSNETRDSFELGKGNTPQSDKYGIHFTTTKNPNSVFNVGNKITSVLLNIQNPKVLPINNESKAQSFDNQSLRGNEFIGDYDSLELPIEIESKYLKQEIGENNYVVFDPKQIHILGGEEDIKMFKEFMENKRTTREITPEQREIINIARSNFSSEEASLIENKLITGEDTFGDLSNFTCS